MDFKKRGKAIIYVSHDMEGIKNFCDTVMYLKQGKVGMVGSPKETVNAFLGSLEKQKQ